MNDYKTYMNEIKLLPNINVIYVLLDPTTNNIRYVGKAINLYIRIRKHFNQSRLIKPNHKNNWIKSLLVNNQRPSVLVIEQCLTEDSMNQAEIKWIKYYKELGCDLTNGTDGGDGGKMSLESIAKMKKTKTGKPLSKEHKEAISKANAGRIVSDETRVKIGDKHKNKIVSDETKLKLSESHKGQVSWNKGKSPSPETKEKMRLARLKYLASIQQE